MPKTEHGKRMKNKNITGIGKKNFIIKISRNDTESFLQEQFQSQSELSGVIPENLFDGRYIKSAIRISRAVIERLTGYAVIIVENVLFFGNTAYIHISLVPHTPIVVSSAGTSENPKPLRYPDITS